MEEKTTLATELLHELKLSARRWFIAFCVMVVLEAVTVAGFLWYISLPIEEYDDYTIEQESTDRSINNIGGTVEYGGETDGQKTELQAPSE